MGQLPTFICRQLENQKLYVLRDIIGCMRGITKSDQNPPDPDLPSVYDKDGGSNKERKYQHKRNLFKKFTRKSRKSRKSRKKQAKIR